MSNSVDNQTPINNTTASSSSKRLNSTTDSLEKATVSNTGNKKKNTDSIVKENKKLIEEVFSEYKTTYKKLSKEEEEQLESFFEENSTVLSAENIDNLDKFPKCEDKDVKNNDELFFRYLISKNKLDYKSIITKINEMDTTKKEKFL